MRFFLSRDCSGHWYLIPLEKVIAWEKFSAIDEDDPRSWKVPKWAKMIDGAESITFTDPQNAN
jgi:hypothetical protein